MVSGPDQILSTWKICDNGVEVILKFEGDVALEVAHVMGIDVIEMKVEKETKEKKYVVAVVGQGIQIVEISV